MGRVSNSVSIRPHDPQIPTTNTPLDLNNTDEKPGFAQDIEAAAPSTPSAGRGVNNHPGLVSQDDQLALFRSLVGIDNAPALHMSSFFHRRRPAQNIGIYGRIIYAEAKAHRAYRTYSFLITACLAVQLLAAAALTALGASEGSPKAVTTFGAINTVIAGFLAYLKGSGLPGRLKYFESEWTKLREYIEQRERDFCRERPNLDLEAEVETIEQMYEAVKGDIEANTPDSFVSRNENRGNMRNQPAIVGPGPVNAPVYHGSNEKGPEARSVLARRTMSSNSLPALEKPLTQPGLSALPTGPRRPGLGPSNLSESRYLSDPVRPGLTTGATASVTGLTTEQPVPGHT